MNANDLEKLNTYEPVLRFARSERFFPMDAEKYLERCQIFPSGPQGAVELVGHLKDVQQKRFGKLQSEQYYLRFVNNPLRDADAWIWWAALSLAGMIISWIVARFYGLGVALTASLLAASILFMLASPIRLRIIPALFAALLLPLSMTLFPVCLRIARRYGLLSTY